MKRDVCWRIFALQEFQERENAGGVSPRQCVGDDEELTEAQPITA
jgi:hypothetical protein